MIGIGRKTHADPILRCSTRRPDLSLRMGKFLRRSGAESKGECDLRAQDLGARVDLVNVHEDSRSDFIPVIGRLVLAESVMFISNLSLPTGVLTNRT